MMKILDLLYRDLSLLLEINTVCRNIVPKTTAHVIGFADTDGVSHFGIEGEL